MNCQCFDTKGWTLELQRALMEAGIIKGSKGNPRYRYGLLSNKSKDDTYVLAVYVSQLEEVLPVQNPVQMDKNPEIQFAKDVDLKEGEEI
ncbi:hypothetical protein RFF05_12565 [Bengtsoniella intestinalis]|uniref:hypothetical protein n=1 Tax=Bengtsoniella intestinalis TaxID=3073143 RepID=UPI00391F9990